MENTVYPAPTRPGVQTTNETVAGKGQEKRGVAEKVKGMLGGHGQRADAAHHEPSVYGDATPATGTAESTRVGCLDKLKAKTGVGHGLAPAQTRAQGGGLAGHHTGAPYADPSASPDFNGGTDVNSSAAVHGGWPRPTNPNEPAGAGVGLGSGTGAHHNRETHNHPTGMPNPFSHPNPSAPASGYGGAQPTNPTGATNAHGGAVLSDHQGNVYEGPRDDNEKREGLVSKIMDKLHSPKGKPANTSTTPVSY